MLVPSLFLALLLAACGGEDPCIERDWYPDGDGDGYGVTEGAVTTCVAGTGFVAEATDCDDASAGTSPAAHEICGDGIDQDCDSGDCTSLSDAETRLVAEHEHDAAGAAVYAGDLDGDGQGDVLVGAHHGGDDRTGAAYVVLGPFGRQLDLADADATLIGESVEGWAGWSVSAGDIDGDAMMDLVVGAWGVQDNAGAVYVVSGPVSGRSDLSNATGKLNGENANAAAGWSVGVMDMDGDGPCDVIVGAIGDATGGADAGAVYVMRGPVFGDVDLGDAGAKLVGEAPGAAVGLSVYPSDLDGDGLGDLVVGSAHAEAAYIVFGPIAGELDLADADAKLTTGGGPKYTGTSVYAYDLDGDGDEEVIVGAPGHSAGGEYAGLAYVVQGPVSGSVDLGEADAKLVGEDGGDWAGGAVSAGDFDADGIGDIVVGAPEETNANPGPMAGQVYIVRGPAWGTMDLSTADVELVGEMDGDGAGSQLSVGNLGGDLGAYLLIGAPYSQAAGEMAGAAYVVHGGGL